MKFGPFQIGFSAAEGEGRDPIDDYWYKKVGPKGAAGQAVTAESGLRVPAVADCLGVITNPIATLPLVFYRRQEDGSKEKLEDYPLARLLRHEPNDYQTGFEFLSQMQWNLAWHRNAFAEIRPGPRGVVDQLIPLDPQRVVVRRLPTGAVRYDVYGDNGLVRQFRADQIWHLKALPFTEDGLCGVPTFEFGRETISSALAVQDYAARFFANDTQTGGIIKHPGHFKDKESKRNFLSAWRRSRSGSNRHKDGVLEHGMEYERTGQTNDEAQFIETRKESALECARLWRVPPHKIGLLDRATFSNIEHQSLEFVTDTMLPWLTLWEHGVKRHLILEDDVFAEFNVAGLLRGDLKARYEAYAIARNWGWMSVNEIRRLENENPVEDGDTYLQPLNMTRAGEEGEPSSQADNPGTPTRQRSLKVVGGKQGEDEDAHTD